MDSTDSKAGRPPRLKRQQQQQCEDGRFGGRRGDTGSGCSAFFRASTPICLPVFTTDDDVLCKVGCGVTHTTTTTTTLVLHRSALRG